MTIFSNLLNFLTSFFHRYTGRWIFPSVLKKIATSITLIYMSRYLITVGKIPYSVYLCFFQYVCFNTYIRSGLNLWIMAQNASPLFHDAAISRTSTSLYPSAIFLHHNCKFFTFVIAMVNLSALYLLFLIRLHFHFKR